MPCFSNPTLGKKQRYGSLCHEMTQGLTLMMHNRLSLCYFAWSCDLVAAAGQQWMIEQRKRTETEGRTTAKRSTPRQGFP
jgi:hypothetical protein